MAFINKPQFDQKVTDFSYKKQKPIQTYIAMVCLSSVKILLKISCSESQGAEEGSRRRNGQLFWILESLLTPQECSELKNLGSIMAAIEASLAAEEDTDS